MLTSRIVENAFTALLAFFLIVNAGYKVAIRLWADDSRHGLVRDTLWGIQQKEVVLEWDSWTRYTLHSSDEWATLYPGNGIVHIGPEKTLFTVSMFHQLRCLDVLRDQLTRAKAHRDTEPTRHCMNYLRQISSCHINLDFEPNQYVHEINPVHPNPVHRCLDWRPVYEGVKQNQEEYFQQTISRVNATREA